MKKAMTLCGLILLLIAILPLFVCAVSAEDIIIDTEKGVPGFWTEPARDLPANWLYVHDHLDTSADGWFDTNAYPPGQGNGSFWYTISFPDMGECKGIWMASLSHTGKYEVFVWISDPDPFDPYLDESTPPSDYLPTKKAQYKIFHNGGVATVTIDQNVNKGGFTSLGVFEFDTTARVELSSNEVEFWRCVAFDAVKFVPVEYTQLKNESDLGDSIDEVIVPGVPPEERISGPPVSSFEITRADATLPNVPAFDWCYGCSATSAAMLFGYYERTGYPNMYTGPTNSGVCPLDNSDWGYEECSLSATHQGFDGLAVKGHVDDYWSTFGSTVDPYYGYWTEHGYADCTADFMGTNQYVNWQNTDGMTCFCYYPSGAPLYDYTGCEPDKRDGCHGIRLFVESRGYNVVQNYNQYIDEHVTGGFTYANFKAEIDAGRPVLIHVEGHTMLGYGYNDPDTIYIHDTWGHTDHSMTWGGSYSGRQHVGVTVIQLKPPSPPPTITSFAPPTPVNDTICTWRTFNITVNQTVNASWYLNGTLQFTNESAREASCRLHANVTGVHNVTAIASNANGTDRQTWVWNTPRRTNCTCGDICVNTTGWWRDGGIFNPSDTPIQSAVDNATAGETICVKDGTYTENVDVNKRLTIRSENGPVLTIVQAAINDSFYDVFDINKANVTISGFTIEGATGTFGAGISVGGRGHCRIENNIFSNNYYAIDITFADNNTIANNQINGGSFFPTNYISLSSSDSNTVSNNELNGSHIRLFSSNNNQISGNVISGKTWYGIDVRGSSNIISDNIISDYKPCGGISVWSSGNLVSNNTFEGCGLEVSSTGNTIENCTVNGKPLMYLENESGLEIAAADVGQIILVGCQNMVVRDCYLFDASAGIQFYQTSDSLVESNTLESNGVGIKLKGSTGNIIRNNICNGNGYGIAVDRSSNNTIRNNNIHRNSHGTGIQIANDAQYNMFEDNNIYDTYRGIWIGSSAYNVIQDNRIYDNDYGIYITYSMIHVSNGHEYIVPTENNSILRNSITNNAKYGIFLSYSLNNNIYLNNFNNAINAYSSSNSADRWNSLEEITYTYSGNYFTNYLGNYWDDYEGSDADGDGIGDAPYPIDSDNDNYPLMERFENYFAIYVPDDYTFVLSTGWNMISFPVDPLDKGADTIFGPDYYYLCTWDSDTGCYVPVDEVETEIGYWLLVLQDRNVTVLGTQLSEYNTDITQGWNMIGSLWTATNVPDGTETVPADQLYPYIYGWCGDHYALTQDIEPGLGYWALAYVDCGLHVFPAPSAAPLPVQQITWGDNDWHVRLALTSGAGTDVAEFGLHEDATDDFSAEFDVPEPPSPPPSATSPYQQVYFYDPENPLVNKLSTCYIPHHFVDDDDEEYNSWLFRLDYSGDASDVTITWNAEDINAVPAEYSLLFIVDGEQIDMRTTPSYTFRAKIRTYEFEIRAITGGKKPDLVIEEEYENHGGQAGSYTVFFVVKNIGTATAPEGHYATLYVDGVEIDKKLVSTDLEPGETYKGSFKTKVGLTGKVENIKVCADSYNDVDELDEANNCLKSRWQHVDKPPTDKPPTDKLPTDKLPTEKEAGLSD